MAVDITCYKCGILFGVPQHWYTKRQEDKAEFFCPNGHGQWFQVSTAEKLKREKEELEHRLQAQLNQANHAKLVAEKERDSAVRAKRRVEKRVAHGVCPCCNKTFSDLSNHMVTEHKEFRLPGGKRQERLTA